jgi:ABC-type transport system involved in multi-copper enzyme maturation permease subunit
MLDVLRLVWFDLKHELTPPVWIGLQWFTSIVQLLIYAALINQIMSPGVISPPANYQQFYAVGFIIIMTFDIGSHAGRQFVEHAHEGRLPYLLSLPISRSKLFLSIALKGAFELALMLTVPFSITLLLIGNLTVLSVSAAVAMLFCLGFGVAGLMLGLSFIAFKSSDMYTAIVTGLSAIIVRFSTIMYPLAFLAKTSPGYASAATLNPLAYGADLVRLFLGFNPSALLNPTLAVAVLMAVAVGTLGLSTFLLQRLVEGVKSA